MEVITVHLAERTYSIRISEGLRGIADFIRERHHPTLAFLVGDTNTKAHLDRVAEALSSAGFRTHGVTIPPGEDQKCLASASHLYDSLVDAGADRRTLVVAMGGGVVGDLAGFVAATFNRGLPLLMVPTTLLAMVDSSVGGKVGINHARGKNLIGAFHQPMGVWIDVATLESLPDREYRSGLAEVVKYGVILDADFFTLLEGNTEAILTRDGNILSRIVARCCRLKGDVVEKDERETTGLRAVLNYGHTFAHAFETVGGYGAWLHGEAVAAGMVCASRLAEARGLISGQVTDRQIRLLSGFKLPVAPRAWPVDDLLSVMRRDKKAEAGKLRFILPVRMGEVRTFDDIPEDQVRAVLRSMGCE